MRFERLTEIAYALRGKHDSNGRAWHCSFILKKSKILSIGLNNYVKTHPKLKELGYSSMSGIHSELSACIKLGMMDCNGLTIVNFRIDNNNKLNLSKPCRHCERLIKALNFSSIYFTNENGMFEEYV